MDSAYKYRIIYDRDRRKGVELQRESMYRTAWYDNKMDQARWVPDPDKFTPEGNSVDSWAVEMDEIKFFVFVVKRVGIFKLEKSDLLEFYEDHPLHDALLYGKKRMVFPASLWKKIEKSY